MRHDKGREAGGGRGSRRRKPAEGAFRAAPVEGGLWRAGLFGAVSPSVRVSLRGGSGLGPAQRRPSLPGAGRCSGLLSCPRRGQQLKPLRVAPRSAQQAILPQSLGGQSAGDGPQATPAQWPGGGPSGRLPPALTLLVWTPGHCSQRWLRMWVQTASGWGRGDPHHLPAVPLYA